MFVKKVFSMIMIFSLCIVHAQIQVDTIESFSNINEVYIRDFVKMSGQWFIAYRDGYAQSHADERFAKEHASSIYLKRSYFTLEKDLNSIFSVRYTQDITIDTEGDDAGNVETRLKYLYLRAKPKVNIEWITGLWLEGGMVHRPWLDYEQKINTYRAQDNMAIERNKIFNSADFGLTIGGNIGPEMDSDFLNKYSNAMKGKYLSYVLGIYNGGGYSSAEKNLNKVIAGRISIRPFPNKFPQLQASGYFNFGKGNSEDNPDFNQYLGFLAYTGTNLTVTSQYHSGYGDFKAKYVKENDPSEALRNEGYSFFVEYKIGSSPIAVWGRHDSFFIDNMNEDETKRYIGGVTYRYNQNIRFILDTEHTKLRNKTDDVYELTLEIVF